MTTEERKTYARRWVNERRKEAGLRGTSRLSKGYKGAACGCTIAKSLEKVGVHQANYTGVYVILSGVPPANREWTDPQIAKFMEDFDAGVYPELVIPDTPLKINKKVVG